MKLHTSFSIYALSTLLAGAVPLLLLPILTRHLSELDYGTVATLTTLITFFTPPVCWGTPSAVSVEFFKLPPAEFKSFFSSTLRISIVGTLAALALAAVGAWLFADTLKIAPLWFALAPAFAALSLLPLLLSTMLRVRNAVWSYAAYELFSTCTIALLSLLFVVTLDLHWEGRMYALGLTYMLGSSVALVWLAKHGYLGAPADRRYIRDAVKFGAGLVPHDLGNQAIRVSDRLFIGAFLGLSSVGQYAVAAQISSIMLVLLSAFNKAWAPYLFSQLKSADAEARESIIRKSYVVIGCAVAFFLVFNLSLPMIYGLLVDRKFLPSMAFVSWLTLGYLFMAVYLTYIDYIFFIKKTHILSAITAFNLACNLALNYLLIPRFGTIGSAYAFACTMFLVMLLAFFLSNRLYPMPWLYWMKHKA